MRPSKKFKAFIYSDSGGSPGSLLYTFNAISDPSGSDVTLEFTAPGGGFALDPDTTYWATFGSHRRRRHSEPRGDS